MRRTYWWGVTVAGVLVLAGCTTTSTDTADPVTEATATVTKCEWMTYPGLGDWVDVAGQVTADTLASASVLIDLEYRIDGELVAVGQGAANGMQPGQTANWIGVIRDVPAGGECVVLRVS